MDPRDPFPALEAPEIGHTDDPEPVKDVPAVSPSSPSVLQCKNFFVDGLLPLRRSSFPIGAPSSPQGEDHRPLPPPPRFGQDPKQGSTFLSIAVRQGVVSYACA